MDALVSLVHSRCPAFSQRVMTFGDFLAVCDAERIAVELKRHPLDEPLMRKPLAKIILNARLAERYRTFAGFHALAHWRGHPAPQRFDLGSPGWLDTIEIEASTIGFLALPPHEAGPPYPRLERAARGRRDRLLGRPPARHPGRPACSGGAGARGSAAWRSWSSSGRRSRPSFDFRRATDDARGRHPLHVGKTPIPRQRADVRPSTRRRHRRAGDA